MQLKTLIRNEAAIEIGIIKRELLREIQENIDNVKALSSTNLETDELAQALLPTDLPCGKLRPIKTTGNGDCLFNAVSLSLTGDEGISNLLRRLAATELFLNAENIAKHSVFDALSKDAGFSKDTYRCISLTDEALKKYDQHKDFTRAIRESCSFTCDKGNWSTLVHIIALSCALETDIYSIYPEGNCTIRHLLNTCISYKGTKENKKPIFIMWSREGNIESSPGALFEPNHFVHVAKDSCEDDDEFEDDIPETVWLSLSKINHQSKDAKDKIAKEIAEEMLEVILDRIFSNSSLLKNKQTAVDEVGKDRSFEILHETETLSSHEGSDSLDDEYSTSDELPLSEVVKNKQVMKMHSVDKKDHTSEDDLPCEKNPKTNASCISYKGSMANKKQSRNLDQGNGNFDSDPSDDEDADFDSDVDLNLLTGGQFSDTESEIDDDDGDEDDGHDDNGAVGPGKYQNIKWTNKLQKVSQKPFEGPLPGATMKPSAASKELDYFYKIFPESIFNLMRQSTNGYIPIFTAAKRKQTGNENWQERTFTEISEADIKAYIAIRMIMALDVKANLDDYWSAHPALQNKLISQTMSRRRFKALQRYIHVNDPTKDPTRVHDRSEAQESLRRDPLYKISPLMEKVRKNSMKNYNLHQNLSVDEAMIKCHGQHWSIVGAPNKPAKRGFKVFVVADAVSGFLWNFQVYLRRQKEKGLTQTVVENLTESLSERNHIVFVDKFYTSIPLAVSLLEKSTYLCGSFNVGRKYWPHDLKIDKKKRKKEDKIRSMKRGDFFTRQTHDGTMVATVWQDSKTVYNLSTRHNPITNKRRDKAERKQLNEEGKWEKRELPCPQAIVEFNKYMGGVDRHDHLRSSYSLQRPSVRWWTYFLWFAVDMSLINAYLIYKEDHPKTSHKKFQLKVAEQLLGGYSERLRTPKQVSCSSGMTSLFAASHVSVQMKGRARVCRYCSTVKAKTGGGRTRETVYGCRECQVNLHRECFLKYHEVNIEQKPTKDAETQTEVLKTPTKMRTGLGCSSNDEDTRTPKKRAATGKSGHVPKRLKLGNSERKKENEPQKSQNTKHEKKDNKKKGENVASINIPRRSPRKIKK